MRWKVFFTKKLVGGAFMLGTARLWPISNRWSCHWAGEGDQQVLNWLNSWPTPYIYILSSQGRVCVLIRSIASGLAASWEGSSAAERAEIEQVDARDFCGGRKRGSERIGFIKEKSCPGKSAKAADGSRNQTERTLGSRNHVASPPLLPPQSLQAENQSWTCLSLSFLSAWRNKSSKI